MPQISIDIFINIVLMKRPCATVIGSIYLFVSYEKNHAWRVTGNVCKWAFAMHSPFSRVDFTLKCFIATFVVDVVQHFRWFSNILIETICTLAKSWADKQVRLFYADLLINFIRFDPYFIILNRFLIEKNFNFGFFMILNTTNTFIRRVWEREDRRRRLKKANDYTVNERDSFFFLLLWASSNLKRSNDFNNLIYWKRIRCYVCSTFYRVIDIFLWSWTDTHRAENFFFYFLFPKHCVQFEEACGKSLTNRVNEKQKKETAYNSSNAQAHSISFYNREILGYKS